MNLLWFSSITDFFCALFLLQSLLQSFIVSYILFMEDSMWALVTAKNKGFSTFQIYNFQSLESNAFFRQYHKQAQ